MDIITPANITGCSNVMEVAASSFLLYNFYILFKFFLLFTLKYLALLTSPMRYASFQLMFLSQPNHGFMIFKLYVVV